MAIYKGESAVIHFYAYTAVPSVPKIGDTANLEATLYYGTSSVVFERGEGDITEIGGGFYALAIPADYTDEEVISIWVHSTTADVEVDAIVLYPVEHYETTITGLEGVLGAGFADITVNVKNEDSEAVADLLVYVTSDYVGSTLVAGPARTDASGNIVFKLNSSTTETQSFYVRIQSNTWVFDNQPYLIEVAPETDDTLNITGGYLYTAEAIAVGTSASDYSFLTRMIAMVYSLSDEPQINNKYTDNDIIQKIQEEYVLALQRVNRSAKNKMLVTWSFTASSTTSRYMLPPTVGIVKAVYTKAGLNGSTSPRFFFYEHQPEAAYPGQMSLEGHTLKFNYADYPEMFRVSDTVYVDYIPSGVCDLFEQAVTTYSATTVTVPVATPVQGAVDRRPNAYLGATLRVIQDANNVQTQERVITSQAFSGTNLVLTFEPALDPVPESSSIQVEVKPPMPLNMDSLIATGVAYRIVDREGSAGRAQALEADYNTKLGDLIQTVNQFNVMNGPNTSRRTMLNPLHRRLR